MGVYLPNMELPKACGPHEITITLFVRDDGTASLWGKEVFIPHEPLEVVSVPPHGDLIDRDALLDTATIHWSQTTNESCFPIDEIEYAPTIIPASKEGE